MVCYRRPPSSPHIHSARTAQDGSRKRYSHTSIKNHATDSQAALSNFDRRLRCGREKKKKMSLNKRQSEREVTWPKGSVASLDYVTPEIQSSATLSASSNTLERLILDTFRSTERYNDTIQCCVSFFFFLIKIKGRADFFAARTLEKVGKNNKW